MLPIDVSIGLEKALPLLAEYYKENEAILQAEVSARTILAVAPREKCLCCIHLQTGKPTSCYLKMRDGQQQSISLETVIAADTRRGPFEWSLQPVPVKHSPHPSIPQQAPKFTYTQPQPPQLPAPTTHQPQPSQRIAYPDTPPISKDAIPIRLRDLDLSWLSSLDRPQQLLLRHVFLFIDGYRSVAAIKEKFPHTPEDKVEQAIIFLLATHFVTFKE